MACVFAGALIAYLLKQDLNWDLLNYHWYNPWAFLHHRLLYDIQPAGGGSYLNPILDLPAYLLRNHLRPVIAGMALGGIQGINAWLVFEVAFTLFKDRIRGWATRFGIALTIGFISLFGAASLSEIGNSMGDNLVSLFILASLLLLLLSFDESKNHKAARYLRIGGYLLAGVAIGLKLTSFVYAIPLLLCGLLVKGRYEAKIRESLWHVLAAGIGLLSLSGYWYFEVWRAFKNPIFPFYNGVFQSPYYPKVNFSEFIWIPTTIFEKVFYPFTIIRLPNQAAKLYFRDPRLAVLFVTGLAAIGYWLIQKQIFKTWPRLRVNRQEWVFLAFIGMSYIFWEKEFAYYRYLLPVELISLVAIALLIYKLISNTKIATVSVAIILGLITLFTVHLNWNRIPWQPYNFGPNLYAQLSGVDGTVLMAPTNPLGFLVPYLPRQDRAISVSGYNTLTTAEKQLIMADIHKDESNHRKFYGIETTNGVVNETKFFKQAGFVSSGCFPVDTYAGRYLYGGALKYEICELTKVTGP